MRIMDTESSFLCLGYKAEMIRDYFRNYLWNTCDATLRFGRAPAVRFHNRHDEEHWTVTLAYTGKESGTAHRIKLIEKYVTQEKTLLLTYGDGGFGYRRQREHSLHEKAGKICTLRPFVPPADTAR